MAPSPPPAARLVLLAALAASLAQGTLEDDAKGAARRSGGSSELLESLRRQLMEDNYEYMSSESDEFPARRAQQAARAPAPSDSLLPFVNDIYIPRGDSAPPPPPPPQDFEYADDSGGGASPGLDKNDLLYYMDDRRLSRRAAPAPVPAPAPAASDGALHSTPKLKYKLLKVKAPEDARRAGAGRGFLQEEGQRGVAIIKLGDEPFPEFRLPSERRQYMADEAPPPSERRQYMADETPPPSARRQYMADEAPPSSSPFFDFKATLASNLDGEPIIHLTQN